MNREGHSIKLYDKQKKTFVDAAIYNEIIDKNIDDFQYHWLLLF
jgi:hypothetical protein